VNSLKIKKNDTVVVLSGKDRGKQGKVMSTNPSAGTVIVEGVNMVTCHVKPRKQGEAGGIIKKEAALRACKLMVVCPKCNKPVRMAAKLTDNGYVRVCNKCGAEL